MKETLLAYEVELKTLGPVYIGSGKEIGKKEYAYSPYKEQVSVFDLSKLGLLLVRKRRMKDYEKYMLQNSREDLGRWLVKQGISEKEYQSCIRYRLDVQDSSWDTRNKMSVLEFIKDAYGLPYVPGSSLKGMLRTILLADDLMREPEKYRQAKRDVEQKLKEKIEQMRQQRKRPDRNICRQESARMEQNAFHTLNRPKSKIQDAVNDKLSGLIVGDSAPLSMKDLMLCQRTELHRDGEEKSLNVLREAIRPGTVIRFPITIDTSVCDITQERIEQAVKAFGEMYYKCFLKEFPKMQPPDAGTVWLGGGTGFATKTEVYPMFGKASGLERAMEIFRATGVPENHRHAKDRALGVSPHICKVTYWNGKRCQMGMCKMTFSPKNQQK